MRKDKVDNRDILILLHLASIPLPWGKNETLSNIAKRNKLFHFLKNILSL